MTLDTVVKNGLSLDMVPHILRLSVAASVAPKQLDVDEVYARNFHKAATARIREKTAAIPVARKLKAIDVVRGKI